MGEGIKRKLSLLLIAALLLGGIEISALAQEREGGITVSSQQEFMDALEKEISPITLNTMIVIGNQAESSGRMKPVVIPGDTLIQGTPGTASGLICRGPVQLEGDGVMFRNMKFQMESTDALNSVPHREIFLAGHSLTMDNVETWLEGGAGDFGDLSGSEEELLPTVYAGGYPDTTVGDHASLTVMNSNANTAFQAIYLGHSEGKDGNVPYQGAAALKLDAGAAVRECVDASKNSSAEITVADGENRVAKANEFFGNANTTLALSKCMMEKASVENIGNLIIEDGGCLSFLSGNLGNVTLKNGGCLDLNGVKEAEIKGDFTGVSDNGGNRGILVLNREGSLAIRGNVAGTTQFQTYNRLFPSRFVPGKAYIRADGAQKEESNFILSEKSIGEGYELRYENGAWITDREILDDTPRVGRVEIISAPLDVDLSKIKQNPAEETIPDETVFFELAWYDRSGQRISNDVVEAYMLYYDMVGIKTEYWESNDPKILNKEDWWNSITLLSSPEEHPGKYYLQADYSIASSGDYTFLFLSESLSGDLKTVADVKALQGDVASQQRVIFWDSEKGQEKPVVTPTPTPTPTATPKPTMTPTPKPSVTPTATPTPKPSVTPTATPTPSMTPTPKPSVTPTATPTPSMTPTPKPSVTPTPTVTPTPSMTPTPSVTPTPSMTPTPTPTVTPTPSVTPTPTPTVTPKPSGIPSKEEHVHQYRTVLERATIQKDGAKMKKCSCGSIIDRQTIYRIQKVELSSEQMVYNGKSKEPKVKVTDRRGKTVGKQQYQVIYQDNIDVGQGKITVFFSGDYTGSLKKNFIIQPKETSLTKLKAGKRGFTIKWKKQDRQTTGYEIQYSTSSKFAKKSTKITTVKSNKTTAKVISKQKAKKKYYVRIRTYKTVKVNGKSTKLYSRWSKAKSVRTKK